MIKTKEFEITGSYTTVNVVAYPQPITINCDIPTKIHFLENNMNVEVYSSPDIDVAALFIVKRSLEKQLDSDLEIRKQGHTDDEVLTTTTRNQIKTTLRLIKKMQAYYAPILYQDALKRSEEQPQEESDEAV